jgi:hypothetical protein
MEDRGGVVDDGVAATLVKAAMFWLPLAARARRRLLVGLPAGRRVYRLGGRVVAAMRRG